MTMTKLREAFAEAARIADIAEARHDRGGLPDCWVGYVGKLAKTVLLLTDPTPITEAGLRELGFHLADIPGKHRIFSLGETAVHIDADGGCEIDANDFSGYVKTLGQLRGLLLFVGE